MGSSVIVPGPGPALSIQAPSGTAPATRRVVQWLGVVAAIAGVEHGVGELWQYRTPFTTTGFASWEGVDAFRALGGEPAMSLVPNYAASGVLSIGLALLLGAWCLTQLHRRHTGWVIVALSVALLLTGGGFGPPLVGVTIGLVATRIGTTPRRWTGPRSAALGRGWRWALAVSVAAFLGLLPGLVVLAPVIPSDQSAPVAVLTVVALTGMAIALIMARAHDRRGHRSGRRSGAGQRGQSHADE